jgi:response regulator RpfG family c-di-GMP phosphodiesterase
MTNQNKVTVLIVDDEAGIRDILSRKLSAAGFTCLTAPDGLNAMKLLKTGQPDLVLLDVTMPGKSGAAVLKDIKSKYPDIAVIMVTAVADVQVVISLMKAGAYDYVIKPVELNVLLFSIGRALEKRKLKLENRDYQLHLEQKVAEQTCKIRQAFLNAIKSLANALDAKDKYTHGHSERVTGTAVAIAREMAMPQETIEQIELAGLLHDIGKIGISEEILNKPARLTREEFQQVQLHPGIGERILEPLIEDKEILLMIRHHHEYYDGSGYPDGLAGGPLTQGPADPATARAGTKRLSAGTMALSVADAYDAMTTDRPYRPAMTIAAACAELEKGKGTQFCPNMVDAFIRRLGKTEKTI